MRSKTLTTLDLTNNQISGEGGFAISLVIKENTGLKNLKLAMNRFDDQNVALILKALTKNTLLEEIDLSSNELGIFVKKFYLFILILFNFFNQILKKITIIIYYIQ